MLYPSELQPHASCILSKDSAICKSYARTMQKGLLHKRPYRLATLATSPALAGEAKMP